MTRRFQSLSWFPTYLPFYKRRYLFFEYTVQDKDKETLQAVKDGEEVRQDEGLIAELKQAKDPSNAQNTELCNGCDCEYPVGKEIQNTT